MDLASREAYVMNREAARMRLVETETGSITETARRWHTSRNVVRKWVERYRDDGAKGLGDRSRRPHRPPAGPKPRPIRLEREILAKAAAWFARETGSVPRKRTSS